MEGESALTILEVLFLLFLAAVLASGERASADRLLATPLPKGDLLGLAVCNLPLSFLFLAGPGEAEADL